MKKLIHLASLLWLAMLASNALATTHDSFAWEDGWRKAVVTAVGTGPELAQAAAGDCRHPDDAWPPGKKFATLRIRKNSRPVWLVVPMSADQPWKLKDVVLVNLGDCRIAAAPPPVSR